MEGLAVGEEEEGEYEEGVVKELDFRTGMKTKQLHPITN